MDRNIRHQQQMISTVPPKRQQQNNFNPNQRDMNSQHDELIKFIHDAWHKVSNEHGHGVPNYYKSPTTLHDFKPFDLESWWGRRMVQNIHISRGPQ